MTDDENAVFRADAGCCGRREDDELPTWRRIGFVVSAVSLLIGCVLLIAASATALYLVLRSTP